MKVQELLLDVCKKDFNLEESLQVKKYLPIEAKRTIAQGIIYESTSTEFGVVRIDSVQRHLAYVRYMITMHTNLEYDDGDYDVLCSTKYNDITLLDAIIKCFDEDAKECSRILDLMLGDVMQEITFEFALAKFLYGVNGSIDKITESINEKINGLDLKSVLPDGVNLGDLFKKMLNK